MMTSTEFVQVEAPAKVNLFLRLLAKEVSGYHQIETLYAAVDFCDEVVLHRTQRGVSIEVVGPAAGPSVGPDEENLAYRAALLLLEAGGSTTGVHIHLTKNIPVGAGLGGGSSDAGATLRALNSLLGDPFSENALVQIAGPLGADVPFFVSGAGAALAWGRGERLLPVPGGLSVPILLALPPLHISTAEAYGSVTMQGRVVPAMIELADLSRPDALAALAMNDFEDSVFERHPELGELREELLESGAFAARLSGSGAALFGLYHDRATADRARNSLSTKWGDVQFLVTETLVVQPTPASSSVKA